MKPVPPAKLLFKHLELNQDPTMAALGTAIAPLNFDFTVPAGKVFETERLMVTCVDDAIEQITGFFTLSALTNGLLIQVIDGDGSTVLQHFGTDVLPIRRHEDFAALAGNDISESSSLGNAARFGIRWTISAAGSTMILYEGQTFRVVVQDDLSSLTQLTGVVQGLLDEVGH